MNIAATTGRALGGPLGGVLCDTVGWRWVFYAQVPPTIIGLLLILWKLPNKDVKTAKPEDETTFRQKLARVDVAGAVVLMISIVGFLLVFEFVNKDLPIAYAIISGVVFLISMVLFYFIETRWVKEPIMLIELFTTPTTLTAYLLAGFQMSAQFGLFYAVPIYFQIISGSNVSQAGLRLVPSVVGNATAGLIAGYTISKTGRYKLFTILANFGGWLSYLLVLLRWRGKIHPAEILYIFLGGFASGANQSTTFIHLAAHLDQSEMAIAGTTLYLIQNLFLLVGLQTSTALVHARLRIGLESGLEGVKHKKQVYPLNTIFSGRSLTPLQDYRVSCLKRQVDPDSSLKYPGYRHSSLPRQLELYLR